MTPPVPDEVASNFLADGRLRRVLLLLHRSLLPSGARAVMRDLAANGFVVSESTSNRLLRSLDQQGLTLSADGKGRALSDLGRAVAERIELQDARALKLDSLTIRSLADLRNTLIARRGLEREIVRAVSETASDADLGRLSEVLGGPHDRGPAPGIQFHRILPSFCGNRSLIALSGMLFSDDEHEYQHENLLDLVTTSSGGKGTSEQEHYAILDALERRDADVAASAMTRHLDRLIAATAAPLSEPAWQAFSLRTSDH